MNNLIIEMCFNFNIFFKIYNQITLIKLVNIKKQEKNIIEQSILYIKMQSAYYIIIKI